MTDVDECARDQLDQSFERCCQSALFVYGIHFLVCKSKLNFDLAQKKRDIAKYQISEVSTIIRKTSKCNLHKPLKTVAAEGTYSLAVKLATKLSYGSCICPEEAKYHRDCMQWFRSGATVIPSPIKYKHLNK